MHTEIVGNNRERLRWRRRVAWRQLNVGGPVLRQGNRLRGDATWQMHEHDKQREGQNDADGDARLEDQRESVAQWVPEEHFE